MVEIVGASVCECVCGGQIVLTPITATAWCFSYLGRCSHSLIFCTYGSAFCIIVY